MLWHMTTETTSNALHRPPLFEDIRTWLSNQQQRSSDKPLDCLNPGQGQGAEAGAVG